MSIERVVADLSQRTERRFDARYRGIVVDNADPDRLGRLRLRVPSVTGAVVTDWADACVPYGGAADQGMLFVPDVGAGVWVEYEEGRVERPVWVGTFWSKPQGKSELPKVDGAVPDPPTRKLFKTAKGHMIAFEDKDKAELVTIVEAANGNTVTMDASGIVITDTHGHEIMLDSGGITIKTSGTRLVVGTSGVRIGGSGATEPLVLGNQLNTQVQSFLLSLSTHTHVGNLGAPTSPPVAPMTLTVPLSTKHKAE